MAEDFAQRLLRLKQVLRVSEDQEVADALGMSRAALSDRKRRGSFPEDKLLALKAKRPELNLDTDYVLTGRHGLSLPPPDSPPPPPQASEQMAAEPRRGKYAPAINVVLMTTCIQAVADEIDARGLDLDHKAVTAIANGVYEMSLLGGKLNTRLVGPMLDIYLEGRAR